MKMHGGKTKAKLLWAVTRCWIPWVDWDWKFSI